MKTFVSIGFVVTCLISTSKAKKLPSYVKTCGRSETDSEKCLIDSMNQIKPHLIKGMPEMGVPPVDPLLIPEMHFDTMGNPRLTLVAHVINATFIGAKDYVPVKASMDFEKRLFGMTLKVPELYLSGHYATEGTVLLLTLKGEGVMSMNFTDVTVTVQMKGSEYEKKGKKHYRFEDNEVDVEFGGLKMRFGNLFAGNPELTDNANKVFNENSASLYKEFKPLVRNTLNELFGKIFNTVHGRFSNDVLYPA